VLPPWHPKENAASVAITIHIEIRRFNELGLEIRKRSNVAASPNGRQFDATDIPASRTSAFRDIYMLGCINRLEPGLGLAALFALSIIL